MFTPTHIITITNDDLDKMTKSHNPIYTYFSIAGEGVGIILISSEIDELTALSDRIIVLNSGRIGDVIDQEHFDGKVIRMSMHKKSVTRGL